jgi:hypothetical protein
MPTMHQLALGIYVVAGVAQLVQLAIQVYGLRRTPHRSIAMLSLATCAGLVYLAAGFGVSILPPSSVWVARLAFVVVAAFALQIVLGLWGTASLLREFRRRASVA